MFEAVIETLSYAAHIQRDPQTQNVEPSDQRKVQFRICVNPGNAIEHEESQLDWLTDR